MSFVHLHLHSEYSLLDGVCRIEEIPVFAKKCGHSAVALTDHGVMYGALSFYKACVKEGVKPIIGCEVYVAPRGMEDRQAGVDSDSAHLVLLVENETGYRNLIAISSESFLRGFYGKPRCDLALLKEHHEGLIALSGCMSGRIAKLLLSGDEDAAAKHAEALAEIFGKDHFYLELQQHGLEQQTQLNAGLKRLSERLQLPMVATNDVHYLRREDAEAQAVMLAIQTNSTLSEENKIGFETEEFYYKSTAEMTQLFADFPSAIENTQKIADMCQFDFDFSRTYLPKYTPPENFTAQSYLKKLAAEGFEKRVQAGEILYAEGRSEEDYRSRMNYELFMIHHMGYDDYYLIVWDFVQYAKNAGIAVGPGRGSGAGSLVAYLIGITDVDSLQYNLLFERFLNPERVSMPDFDIDFCWERRDEVLHYVQRKYGQDHVSQIITFGTMAARAAVRDVGRVLGVSYQETDALAKAIQQKPGVTLTEAMQDVNFKALYEAGGSAKKIVDIAMRLEGLPRHASTHAAGVVITDKPVSEYVPLASNGGVSVTQYDMNGIEQLGLLKFDFLALRYLTVMQDAERMIQEIEPDFSLRRVPLNDHETFDMLGQGQSDGVFQLESPGVKQLLTALKPESVEDIMIVIALYRPGPMDSIPKYLENRKDRSRISYEIPQLSDILDETCGCIVYQEQVMRICRQIAGFSYGKADIIRRAMAKKKPGEMEKEAENFLAGAERNHIEREAAKRLFDEMASFSKYAFNKNHAAPYALTSYRTAYLKCHYPSQYLAALLSSVLDNQAKMSEYIADAARMGIRILQPDVNQSGRKFSASGKTIRFGLPALKNVGENVVDKILALRSERAFSSFEDFVRRMTGPELNKRALEAMIRAGAFDSLEHNRAKLLAVYENMADGAAREARENIAGQVGFFDDAHQRQELYPDIPDFSLREKISMERDSAGFSFSGHLLDEYQKHLSSIRVTPINEILLSAQSGDGTYRDRQMAAVAGITSQITVKQTKKNEQMAFLTLEDRYASMELLLFPAIFGSAAAFLQKDAAVAAYGELSMREDEAPKLLVKRIIPLQTDADYHPTEKPQAARNAPAQPAAAPHVPRLYIKVERMEGRLFRRIEALLEIFSGNTPVVIYDAERKKYVKMRGGADVSTIVCEELAALLGRECVVLK